MLLALQGGRSPKGTRWVQYDGFVENISGLKTHVGHGESCGVVVGGRR